MKEILAMLVLASLILTGKPQTTEQAQFLYEKLLPYTDISPTDNIMQQPEAFELHEADNGEVLKGRYWLEIFDKRVDGGKTVWGFPCKDLSAVTGTNCIAWFNMDSYPNVISLPIYKAEITLRDYSKTEECVKLYYTRSLDKDFYVELWDNNYDDGHNVWIHFRANDGTKMVNRYENFYNTSEYRPLSITADNLYGCSYRMVKR